MRIDDGFCKHAVFVHGLADLQLGVFSMWLTIYKRLFFNNHDRLAGLSNVHVFIGSQH